MKTERSVEKDIKTDMKHDTMEFSAHTDGEDRLDSDDITYEEEEITADELDALGDQVDSEAMALNSVETDRLADDDNLPEEDWMNDLKDDDEDAEEPNHHRSA